MRIKLQSVFLAIIFVAGMAQSARAETGNPGQLVAQELTDVQVEDIVRRSYQYVALYNVINKSAMDPETPARTGWNHCIADTGLKDIEHIALALLHTKGNLTGSVRQCDLTEEYKKHVLKFLRPKTKKMKIAIDASNGMAGKMVPAIFEELPVKIIKINFIYRKLSFFSPIINIFMRVWSFFF